MEDIKNDIKNSLRDQGLVDEDDLETTLMAQGYEWDEIASALEEMIKEGTIGESISYWLNDEEDDD